MGVIRTQTNAFWWRNLAAKVSTEPELIKYKMES
jgi:hypothetical protein